GRLGRDGAPGALPARRILAVPARLHAERNARRPLRPGGEPMSLLRPRVVFLSAFLVALSLVAARAALGAFVDQCNYNAPTPSPYMTRDGSLTVAIVAMYEGYHWGGGWWNDNDADEGPNEPLQTVSSGGEGGDCSGLTFKVWRESLDKNDGGHYQWGRLRNVHGPYNAAMFKAGDGVPNAAYSKVDAAI